MFFIAKKIIAKNPTRQLAGNAKINICIKLMDSTKNISN
jgi:hypothetical protein